MSIGQNIARLVLEQTQSSCQTHHKSQRHRYSVGRYCSWVAAIVVFLDLINDEKYLGFFVIRVLMLLKQSL